MRLTKIGVCAHCGREVYGSAWVSYVPQRVWCSKSVMDAALAREAA